MRRFNYANRSTLFTPTFYAVYANVRAKRESGFPENWTGYETNKGYNSLIRLLLFSGYTAIAGLLFGAYKIGRYVEQSSEKYKSKDEITDANGYKIRPIHIRKLEMPEVPFGPKTEQEAKPIKVDLSGFKIDSTGNWSRFGGLELAEQENSPKP